MAFEQRASMSCYLRSEGKPQLRESVVCYTDILGFENRVRAAYVNDAESELLVSLDNALRESRDSLDSISHVWGSDLDSPQTFSIKLFSDNLVLGYPFGRLTRPVLLSVIDHISVVQCIMAAHGFILRGGLAAGSHFMDQNLVYGHAYIEAARLDKKHGPPCICLAQSAKDVMPQWLTPANKDSWLDAPFNVGEGPQEWYMLLKDDDERLFINYLDVAFEAFENGCPVSNQLERHRDQVNKGIESGEAREKYEWAAKYHNFVCSEFSENRVYRAVNHENQHLARRERKRVGELQIPGIEAHHTFKRLW
ncbi:hypothetical protein ACFLS0_06475 [Candidatus Bipolaricaulota bacterium]